jgi:nucleoside-diphosphate-sugar epimerase
MGMMQCKMHNEKYGTKWKTAINTNLYGPMDRSGDHAHVVGALMSKFVYAIANDLTEIEIWGDGTQTRDILYIEDAITAMDLILNNDEFDVVNVASGYQITIKELADTLQRISGFTGRLWFNEDRPTGVKSRSVDNSRLQKLGWKPQYSLEAALEKTYDWYRNAS